MSLNIPYPIATPTVFLIIVKSAYLLAICLLIFIMSIHVFTTPSTAAPSIISSFPIAKYTEFPTNTLKYPLIKPRYAV